MSDVNPHYLDHVVELSKSSDIEASEDIVSGTGMKLVAKGAKIDARVRERLLQFRLTKPLENMMRVVGGTDPASFHPVGERMLARHPLLHGICGSVPGPAPIEALKTLTLSPHLQSLLSVYAAQGTDKLEHAVGVALLSAALAGGLSSNPADVNAIVVAGLAHDVGELYVDPAFLQRGVKLTPQQWKHVVTHPIIGSHVLTAMPGAGPRIATVVMAHHERLDGFGYPQGLHGSNLSMAGQVLAVAEMLMGLMESGADHAARATVAMKLVPGEFHRRFVDQVARAASASGAESTDVDAATRADIATRIARLAASLQHVAQLRSGMAAEMQRFAAPLRSLVSHAFARWERIRIGFSSTGLDLVADGDLQAVLGAMSGADLTEVRIVIRELQWRLGELERQMTIRSEPFDAPDARRVHALIEQANWSPGTTPAVTTVVDAQRGN